jgi:hypothetical protein
VRFILGVAPDTFLWGGFEIIAIAGIEVALRTFHINVFAGQFEGNLCVIKILTERFKAIVAIGADKAKGQCVGLGVNLIHLQVTLGAGVLLEGHQVFGMAVLAGEGIAIGQRLMGVEGEAQVEVREGGYIEIRERRIGAAMFRVTGATLKLGLIPAQLSMQRVAIHEFFENIRVAGHAVIRHLERRERRSMAGRAVIPDFGVGGHACQGRAA